MLNNLKSRCQSDRADVNTVSIVTAIGLVVVIVIGVFYVIYNAALEKADAVGKEIQNSSEKIKDAGTKPTLNDWKLK